MLAYIYEQENNLTVFPRTGEYICEAGWSATELPAVQTLFSIPDSTDTLLPALPVLPAIHAQGPVLAPTVD